MGTSLSGLTPATTFDGLLKVGDNDPLTSTLKAISTGDGTDTILSLSNSSLKISGTGNTANDIPFSIVNSDGVELLKVSSVSTSSSFIVPTARIANVNFVSGNVITGNNTNLRIVPQQGGVSINKDYSNADTSTMLHVKGSGATSATTSLLVQNSDASASLTYDDSGKVEIVGNSQTGFIRTYGFGAVGFGNESGPAILYGNNLSGLHTNSGYTAFGANSSSSQRVLIKGTGATSATTSLLVQNSSGSDLLKVRDDGKLSVSSSVAGGLFATFENTSSTGFGLDIKAGVSSSNHTLQWRNYVGAGGGRIYPDGVIIGTQSTPSARLHIKGSGATSATTALLVQNSAGTEHLKITDDGTINARHSIIVNHATNSSRYLALGWGAVTANSTGDELSLYGGGGVNGAIMYLNGSTKSAAPQAIGMKTTGVLIAPSMVQSSFAPSSQLHVKVGTTQDSIAKFEDPRATTDYIEIKNDSTLTDYTGLYWGTVAKIRSKQTGAMFLDCTSGILFADGNSGRSKIDANGNMSIGTPTIPASTRVTIKGSGATSATTSLLVQNSAGTEHLKVTDDGITTFSADSGNGSTPAGFELQPYTSGSPTWGPSIKSYYNNNKWLQIKKGSSYYTFADGGLGINMDATPSAQLHVKGSGNSSADYALKILNSDNSTLFDIRNDSVIRIAPNSTNAVSFRNAKMQDGNAVFGTTTIPASTRVTIKGQGATSATTSLLVQNSAGTDTLEVRDDGRVVTGKGATTNANGTFNVLHGVSNLTTRVFTVSRDSVLRGMDINSGGATKISDSSGDQSFSHTATAVLEVSSTNKGFLPPRMTSTQRDAITSPASGLIIYNTTTNKAQCYNGTSWNDMF